MKVKLILLILVACINLIATAQNKRVTGVVFFLEDEQPVIGASVLVKGTQIGTITDVDGKFNLPNVPSSAKTLVVSYIGMQTQEVAIKPNVKILMYSDIKVLDEVMVVAYGTTKRSAFTGSATVVSSEQIGKIQSSNAANALAGKVSGVQLTNATGQPGSNPTIRIRGISSINAGNSPLYVVDGVPYDGDVNNISAQDIESMSILKDAAASALYGARGANGVIIITTKKGTAGRARITVDAKWGSNSRGTQDYNYIKDPGQYYEMWYSALKNYFVNTLSKDDVSAHNLANQYLTANNSYGLGYNVYSVPEGQDMIDTNGKLNPNATLGNVVEYNGQSYMLLPDDWADAAYKNSLRQEYSLIASAGNDRSSFYASFNYLKNEGISNNSDYTRLTGRLKGDYQLKSWLKIGANMNYTHFDSNALDNDGSSGSSSNVFALTMMAPIYPLYIRDGNGNILKDDNGITRYDYGDGENAGLYRPYLGRSNAISSNILDTNNAEGSAMMASGFAEILFLKDFKFTTTNNVNVDETRSSYVTNPYYGSYASSNGILTKYHTRSFSYNFQQLLKYRHTFGLHNVEAMIGHEAYRYKYYYLYANKTNMFDPNNSELAGAVTDGSNSSYTTDYNTEGYFTNAQYNYDEKYFVSASYRRDASSRFHPDNRWGNFWSLGGAWIISKESFFNVGWVDELKIKASYGSQGNDAIGDYRYTSTYSIVNSSGNPAAVPYTLGNKDITWETNGNFNAGIEFSILKNRLNGTIEFFSRKTDDMLFSFPLPPSYGYTSYYDNIGDMRNRGIEVELKGTVLRTKDLEWDLNLNLTHYKNKITKLPDERKTMETDGVKGFSSGSFYYGEGESLYTYRIYKYAGVNKEGLSLFYKDVTDSEGNVIGQETTTEIDEATYHLCGTTLPDVYGGFGTSLTYKNFDFSADFTYQIGGKVYDSDYASAMAGSKGHAFHADLLNAWTPENNTSNIPRLQYNDSYTGASSNRFLTNASYLNLQNITFGYTLPSSCCRTLGLEKLRIYATADNVWLWSKRQGLDPRQSISGGITSAYYAAVRTISGGITITF